MGKAQLCPLGGQTKGQRAEFLLPLKAQSLGPHGLVRALVAARPTWPWAREQKGHLGEVISGRVCVCVCGREREREREH